MSEAADVTAIINELHRYAELLDSGLLHELGQLMEHCTLRYGADAVAGPSGAEAITALYRATVIIHEDGTPRTRHIMSNPIIEFALPGRTARATAQVRSCYTVLQQVGDRSIDTVISGRYHDTFAYIDGRWRIVERRFFMDLVGDLSRHLRSPEIVDEPQQGAQP